LPRLEVFCISGQVCKFLQGTRILNHLNLDDSKLQSWRILQNLMAVLLFESVSLQISSTEMDRFQWIIHFDPLIRTVLESSIEFITNLGFPRCCSPRELVSTRACAIKSSTFLHINASIKSLCGSLLRILPLVLLGANVSLKLSVLKLHRTTFSSHPYPKS
jgi:hypothetical protein